MCEGASCVGRRGWSIQSFQSASRQRVGRAKLGHEPETSRFALESVQPGVAAAQATSHTTHPPTAHAHSTEAIDRVAPILRRLSVVRVCAWMRLCVCMHGFVCMQVTRVMES